MSTWVDKETGYIRSDDGVKYPEYEDSLNHYHTIATTISGMKFPVSSAFAFSPSFYDGIYNLFKSDYYGEVHGDKFFKFMDKDDFEWFIRCGVIYAYGATTYKLTNLGREGMVEAKKFLEKVNKAVKMMVLITLFN